MDGIFYNAEHSRRRGADRVPVDAPAPRAEQPRRRGADEVGRLAVGATVGAPPQARGRLEVVTQMPIGEWSTPAGAGPTEIRCEHRDQVREHPRRRGADDGEPKVHVAAHRSTPAGAGPTASMRTKTAG